jgi:hypothetical protein
LAIAAGFVALGLVATLLATPLYTATSTLEIQREDYNIVQVDGVEPEGNSVDLEFYQTQYGLLRSDSLALRVAREMRLYDNAEFFEMFGVNEYDDMFRDGRPLPSAVSGTSMSRRSGCPGLWMSALPVPARDSRQP